MKEIIQVPDFENLDVALAILGMTKGQIEEWVETRFGLRFKGSNETEDHMDTPGTSSTYGSTGRNMPL